MGTERLPSTCITRTWTTATSRQYAELTLETNPENPHPLFIGLDGHTLPTVDLWVARSKPSHTESILSLSVNPAWLEPWLVQWERYLPSIHLHGDNLVRPTLETFKQRKRTRHGLVKLEKENDE